MGRPPEQRQAGGRAEKVATVRVQGPVEEEGRELAPGCAGMSVAGDPTSLFPNSHSTRGLHHWG